MPRHTNFQRPTHSYVARKPCGCVVAVSYDLGDKETGKTIGGWVAQGYTVERVEAGTPAYSQLIDNLGCTHEPMAGSDGAMMPEQTPAQPALFTLVDGGK